MVIFEKGRIAVTGGKQQPLFDFWSKKDYYSNIYGIAIFGFYLCLEYVTFSL